MRQITAEFKKLFTIRTTYIFLGLSLLMLLLFAFFIDGYHMPVSKPVTDPHKMYSEITSAVSFIISMIALIGALLVTNEYRYNTVLYTLTYANKRLKVLLAKVVVISIFVVITMLACGALSPLLASFGLHLKGVPIVGQTIPIWDTLWRVTFFSWGYAMLVLLLAFIIRNQVGTIVTVLFLPGPVEALLGLLLKNNVAYLPFTALNNVLTSSMPHALSHGKSALIVCAYIAVLAVVAVILFQKRDAN